MPQGARLLRLPPDGVIRFDCGCPAAEVRAGDLCPCGATRRLAVPRPPPGSSPLGIERERP